jgi:riboflavin synthase
VFTGIIKEVGRVTGASPGRLVIAASSVLHGMEPGGSIAVNGACLTVASFDAGSFLVDVMPETARRTNLGLLTVGDRVNLEPPLTVGEQLGGHLVQGHVDGTARVVSVVRGSGEMTVRLEAPPDLMRYVVEKGFIAVDGVSLTIASRDATSFQVSIVDYTRRHTTLDSRKAGDLVNLEADIIAKYVEQFSQTRRQGITVEFLGKHGFMVT